MHERTEGQILKDEGVAQVTRNNKEWVEDAMEVIHWFAGLDEPFTADNIRQMVGDPPHPNCIGAAFRNASKAGKIKFEGYQQSKRKGARARVLTVWTCV